MDRPILFYFIGVCKISLQNEKNIFLKTNSKECISKTKDLYGKLSSHLEYLKNLLDV